ncbi:hypothetical protein JCM8547_007061 [Rhodosporidiobolus lusitaniae]
MDDDDDASLRFFNPYRTTSPSYPSFPSSSRHHDHDHHEGSGFNTKLLAILLPSLSFALALVLIGWVAWKVREVRRRVDLAGRGQGGHGGGEGRREEREREGWRYPPLPSVLLPGPPPEYSPRRKPDTSGGCERDPFDHWHHHHLFPPVPSIPPKLPHPRSRSHRLHRSSHHPSSGSDETDFDRGRWRSDKEASSVKIGGRPPVVENAAEEFVKNPPVNHPDETKYTQDRASDLVGRTDTEPIDDTPQTEEEKKRVQALADKLNAN